MEKKLLPSCLMLLFVIGLTFAEEWTNFTTTNSVLPSNAVKAVVVDATANKWFGTDNGLCAFDGQNWAVHQKTDEQQTLAHNEINALAFEITGYGPEIWIATENGVSVTSIPSIDAVTFATPYRTDNMPLVSDSILSVAVDTARHQRWFGTTDGLSMFDGDNWQTFTTETEVALAHNCVTSVGVDYTENWKYMGTKGNGVSRLQSKVDGFSSASPYDYQWSGLLSPNVYAVFVDTDGSQWFGTERGVAYHDTTETKAQWEVFATEEGLVHDYVLSIEKDADGVMWIGTKGGVSAIKYQWFRKYDNYGFPYDSLGYTITNYTTNDGLAGDVVYDIALDHDGSLWFATDAGVSHLTGVTRVNERLTDQLPKAHGLLPNYPNPFNPATTIEYRLASGVHVDLTVTNMRGEKVKTLVNTNQAKGVHQVTWNGRNNMNQPAPTGIYFARLLVSGQNQVFTDTRKLLLVK